MHRTAVVLAGILACIFLIAPIRANATRDPDTAPLQPYTRDLLVFVNEHFPEVPDIGGYRPDPIPDHPSGRALDIMVYGDTALGNRIYSTLLENKQELHIRYLLWQVPNHYNHIHACVD
jgi:peptidoglycan DL-endopeptidase CwlO